MATSTQCARCSMAAHLWMRQLTSTVAAPHCTTRRRMGTQLSFTCCASARPMSIGGRRAARTPLHCAVQANHVDCAETLMLWGASVWIEDGRGRNVMVAARESGHKDMIDMIEDMMEDDGQQETTQLDVQEWQ